MTHPLDLIVQFAQTDTYLADAWERTVTFAADQTTAELSVPLTGIPSGTGSGTLTATVEESSAVTPGAPDDAATLEVQVFSPAMTLSLPDDAATFDEDAGAVTVTLKAESAVGAPQPNGDLAISVALSTRGAPSYWNGRRGCSAVSPSPKLRPRSRTS